LLIDHDYRVLWVLLLRDVIVQGSVHLLTVHAPLSHEFPELLSVVTHHVRNFPSNVLVSHVVVGDIGGLSLI